MNNLKIYFSYFVVWLTKATKSNWSNLNYTYPDSYSSIASKGIMSFRSKFLNIIFETFPLKAFGIISLKFEKIDLEV